MKHLTTKLSLSSLRPVSFSYDTTNGHTPTKFATLSTGEVVCNDGLSQCGTRRHTVPSFCALQAVHSEFCHGERATVPKHRHSSPLEATLHQPEINCGVLHEFGTVPISQIASKSLWQNMRTSMQRHNRRIWTSSIQYYLQNDSLQCSIGAESAQHRNTNTAKCGSLPRPHHNPTL